MFNVQTKNIHNKQGYYITSYIMELDNRPWIIHWQRGLECGMKRKKSSEEEMIRSTFADGNAHTVKVRIPGLPHLVLQNLVVEVLEELGLNVQGNGGGQVKSISPRCSSSNSSHKNWD